MVFSSDAGDKLVELGVATPFTEATSSSYYHRQQPVTLRRRGALQLPELRRLLDALKASRGWAPRGRWWLVETGPATRGSRAAHAEGGLRHPVAELMLYDRMVSNDVMDLARLLYVSKTTKYHSRT